MKKTFGPFPGPASAAAGVPGYLVSTVVLLTTSHCKTRLLVTSRHWCTVGNFTTFISLSLDFEHLKVKAFNQVWFDHGSFATINAVQD